MDIDENKEEIVLYGVSGFVFLVWKGYLIIDEWVWLYLLVEIFFVGVWFLFLFFYLFKECNIEVEIEKLKFFLGLFDFEGFWIGW